MTTDVRPRSTARAHIPTGPPGGALLGHLRILERDPVGTLLHFWQEYGDVVPLRFGPLRAFLLVHPDAVRHVLQTGSRNFDKDLVSYRRLKLVLGEGLVTSDGEVWRRSRRLAQPAFTTQRLRSFATLMTDAAEQTAERWRRHAGGEQALDVHREMMALALRIVGEAMLGFDPTAETAAVGNALDVVLQGVNRRIYSPFPLPLWVPTPGNRRLRAAIATLDEVVTEIVEERRRGTRSAAHGDDLLARLMAARDEEGEGLDDRQLRDEIMTIFLAGHETTANALTFTWFLLSRHPRVAADLRSELAAVLGGRTPTVDDLERLPLTSLVVEESMRLYPPVWIVERHALAADEIAGVPIPRGAIAMVSPFLTHRHPEFWDNPEGFDPQRFAAGARLHPFAFYPFGGGPRVCLGAAFARLEARLVLATLAQRVRLDLLPGHRLELVPTITLRPRGGLPMRVRPL